MLHTAAQHGVRLALVLGAADSDIGRGGAGTPATYMQWVSGSLNLTGAGWGAVVMGALARAGSEPRLAALPAAARRGAGRGGLKHRLAPLHGRPAGTTLLDFYTDPRARLLYKRFLCALANRCLPALVCMLGCQGC